MSVSLLIETMAEQHKKRRLRTLVSGEVIPEVETSNQMNYIYLKYFNKWFNKLLN